MSDCDKAKYGTTLIEMNLAELGLYVTLCKILGLGAFSVV